MKYLLVVFALLTPGQSDQFLGIGDEAPDIVMKNIDGQEIRLSSQRGKVVLLDFWASWCKPCRKENPMLVRMYDKYKDTEFENGNGFTVFSVSLDKKQEAWLKAIKTDSLIWTNHVSDLKGWKNEAAQQYRISSIPQSYLLDGEGKVIAVNPRGSKLEKELKNFKESDSFFKSLFD